MKAILVTLIAVTGAALLAVWSNYGTINPCGILRAKVRAEATREGVGIIASMLPDGIIDGFVAAQYGTLSPGRCIALAFEGPPSPPLAAPRSVPLQAAPPARLGMQVSGSPDAIKQAGLEAQTAIMECKNKRLSGELRTYKASAECSNPKIINVYQRAGYRYMDLIVLMTAERTELSERIDMGQMTEAQAPLAFAQIMTGIIDREQQRDKAR